MKPVTIDNLKIEDHVRWANDQTLLDPAYIKEASLVAHHPELLWTSTLHTPKWDELFDWQKRNIPFAHFETPERYHLVSKRLFSYRLFPNIYWEESDDEQDQENHPENELKGPDLIKEVIALQKNSAQSTVLFEKEKSCIINLLEEIKELNALLGQINARKLQYQKG